MASANEEKLRDVFAESLGIPREVVVDNLTYNTIRQWDSVGHMALIAAIDDAFDTMLETEDLVNMSTFEIAKTILAKYDVEF